MSILLKKAKIVNPGASNHNDVLDIHIENGNIVNIAKDIRIDDVAFQIEGISVSPGWVDGGALCGDPGMEYKEDIESLSGAASAGGFTHVCCYPNTSPVLQSKEAISFYLHSSEQFPSKLLPMGAVSANCEGKELTEMYDMHKAGAVAFSDGIRPIWHTGVLLKALQYSQNVNTLIIDIPTDKYLSEMGTVNEGMTSVMNGLKGIPSLAEHTAIARALELVRYTGSRIHFSQISTKESVEAIAKAKKEGLPVTCGVAAYQLLFTEDRISGFDPSFKTFPPLRGKSDQNALLQGIKDDTIDIIISHHIPQDDDAKKQEFESAEFGMASIDFVYTWLKSFSDLSDEIIVKKLAINPRNIFGLTNADISEGDTADMTVFSSEQGVDYEGKSLFSKATNYPALKSDMTGRVLGIIRGEKSYFS